MPGEPSTPPGGAHAEFLRLLVGAWTAGRLDTQQVLPALVAALGAPATSPTRRELLESIEATGLEGLEPLARHLRAARVADARAYFERRQRGQAIPPELARELADLPTGAPLGGARRESDDRRLADALDFLRDQLFVDSRRTDAPAAAEAVEAAARESRARLGEAPTVWDAVRPRDLLDEMERAAEGEPEAALPAALAVVRERIEFGDARARAAVGAAIGTPPVPLPPDLDEATVLAAIAAEHARRTDPTERRKLLDWVLIWPTDRAIPILDAMCDDATTRERAALVLTLRFGQGFGLDWIQWRSWLRALAGEGRSVRPKGAEPGELLYLWYASRDDAEASVRAALEDWCRRRGRPVTAEEFVGRWVRTLWATERAALLGAPAPDTAAPPATPIGQPPIATATDRAPGPAAPAPPPEPPSFWREHVQGFLAENWYLAAGVVMVVVGASLLAYFTWDRHWLLRYTIMPGLLALFTFALAGMARWLEVRDDSLRGTGATLRGAAIGLLPVNFMAVALLANDPAVAQRMLVVPLMAGVYLALFGYGLARWCREVGPRLGPLAPTLLFLNGLVLLPPLAGAVADGQYAMPLLVAGFHVGFLVLAATVVRFARHDLDRAGTIERRIPWFVGGTLVLTYLEVFAWVHGSLHRLPPAHVYAALVVLTGGLVLFAERRFLELSPEPGRHRVESFLGFAILLLGVLMGAGDPWTRILTLALAGAVWLYQASHRAEALHYWIAMVFLVLAGASVGLLAVFPGPWLPGLGIALAIGVGATGTFAPAVGKGLLRAACRELQAAVLVITAVVAVLAQWHFRSRPMGTAAALGAVVLLFAWRAWRDDSLRAVHVAAVVASLALPYLGFVDLEGRTFQGNTMVFGLALLAWAWIVLLVVVRSRLLLEARSTVLWMYGAFALAAMVLRVIFERDRVVDPLWYRSFPEYLGPLLMAAALVVATYTSRSLVPAIMASTIAVILLPELKANFQATFPRLSWGTGYGSAWNALLMVLVSFRLRAWPRLRALGEGDRFLGREPFPLRRFDHTLFTGPLLATALFLIVRVDLWTLPQHLDHGAVPLRTGAAVCVTGVAWTLLAVYFRHRPQAVLGVHFGWAALFVGLPIVYEGLVEEARWPDEVLTALLVLQGLDLLYRGLALLHPWVRGLLAVPTRGVLRFWSVAFALLVTGLVIAGKPLYEVRLLAAFLALELAFCAVVRRKALDGWVLCGLEYVVLLAEAAPGRGPLLAQLSVEYGLNTTLWVILGVQLAHLALEAMHAGHNRLQPILLPAQALATALAAGLGLFGLAAALFGPTLSPMQHVLLMGAVCLTARAHGSGPFALVGLLLGYELVHLQALRALAGEDARFELLLTPWRWSALALVLALVGEAGRRLAARRPRWLAGPFGFPLLAGPALPWIHGPAALFAALASARHTLRSDLRSDPVQLAAPYLGALTQVLVGWSSAWPVLFPAAAVLLGLGNVHLVRLYFGERLRAGGLSEVHLVSLGLALTLLQGTLVRLLARRDAVTAWVNRASLVVAALVLSLLSATYATHPNLEAMTPLRFAASGLMALAAGFYFRRAARHPARGEEAHAELCEGLYHFGLAVAVWCAALLFPWFRRPSTALLALGLPALYFYARAEIARRDRVGSVLSVRYRHSASLLAFVLLGLYALRPVFQMTLFPETPIWTDHYHYYAVFAMALGLLMMRLTGLGGTEWLAFYGGLSLMAGSYFGLTAWPGLSPFEAPLPAAWCAIGLAHFWTLASAQRSPLRSLLQDLSALADPDWIRLRAAWGRVVLVSSQGVVLLALLRLLDHAIDSHMAAPLLLGAASVFAHHARLYVSPWRWVAAGLQVTLALHADFFVPSTLPRDLVVWVILLLWAVLLVAARRLRLGARTLGPSAFLLAAMVMGHVLYHHPSSATGLWAVAAIAFLATLTPRETSEPSGVEERLAALLLLIVPSWLVFFSQAPLREEGLAGVLHTWPLLATIASVFLIGVVAMVYQPRWLASHPLPNEPRLAHHVLAVLGQSGATIHTLTLAASFIGSAILQLAHYGRPYAERDLLLFCALYAALAVAWYHEGGVRRASLPYALAEASLLCAFALVRSQLLLTTPFWRYEYDVWVSLAVSFLLAGAKQTFDRRPPELRLPFVASILVLPAVAISWTLIHHLGSDVTLIVVGLHSLMFASMGRDRRDSPYNFAATAGFVAFVLIVFWTKLELRALSAYVIPVGLGVLALLQMFGHDLPSATRNRIRLVTLLSMLGSAAWYALVDDRYPLAFNLTLLVLCLAAMALGSLLRIRLYLVLGFAGLLVDVGSILVKGLVHMERGERMTSVGLLVLLLGAGLVGGAAYYKTHRRELDERLDSWRSLLRSWE